MPMSDLTFGKPACPAFLSEGYFLGASVHTFVITMLAWLDEPLPSSYLTWSDPIIPHNPCSTFAMTHREGHNGQQDD